jgi:hypothetical protein
MDGAQAVYSTTAYGVGDNPAFLGRQARGSVASPSASQTNDILSQLTAHGYGTTGFSAGSRGKFAILAAENWTDTAQGTYIQAFLTGTGTTTPLQAMLVNNVSTALGYQTTAAIDAVAIGVQSDAAQQYDTCLGFQTTTSGGGGEEILIGALAHGTGTGSIVIGVDAVDGGFSNSVIMTWNGVNTAANQFVCGGSVSTISDVYFGNGAKSTTPAAWTAHGTAGSGANVAGAALFSAGGQGTGTGLGGIYGIQVAPHGASSSTANALVTASFWDEQSNVVLAGGGSVLATTATNGFDYLARCAGTPTGVPAQLTGTYAGGVPLVVDTSGNKIWGYYGGAWTALGGGGGTSSLSSVLAVGNTTGGNNIIISSGDSITSPASTQLVITSGSSSNISITSGNGAELFLASSALLKGVGVATASITLQGSSAGGGTAALNGGTGSSGNSGGQAQVLGGAGTGTNIAGGISLIAGGQGTGTGFGGSVFIQVAPHGSSSSTANALVTASFWDEQLNQVLGGTGSALATTATAGWAYLANTAGVPTGTPVNTYTGATPLVIDTTDSRLYGYISGAWVNLSSGSASSLAATLAVGNGSGPNNINMASGQVVQWNADTGLSRNAAAELLLGNGTQGDFSGEFVCKMLAGIGTATTTIGFQTYVNGDANERIAAYAGGQLGFGNGAGALNTGLSAPGGTSTLGLMGVNALTTPQTFAVYNTSDSYISPTNSEYVSLGWLANLAVLNVGKTGTGTQRALTLAVGGSGGLTINTSQQVSISNIVNAYNGISTAGWGVPAIYGSGRQTAQTGADSSVATYSVGASADGSFTVSCNVNVTASVTNSFSVTCAYTDETNASRVLTMPFVQLGGVTLIGTITNVTGTGPYEGVPLHIRAKAGTSITVATSGTFTSVTYNVEATIIQIG